jgi:hypothetical protein
MLPMRYREAVARAATRMVTSGLASGEYTIADDGWSSRRKIHYSTVTVGRPFIPSETVALCRVDPGELHGVAIAKVWEDLTLLSARSAPLEEYPTGFSVTLPGRPFAFVSDSAGPNVRARAIAALRHPQLIFIPCFAHVIALLCGDYLCSSRRAGVIAESQRVVQFFNASSSVWLPLLRTEMTRTLGKTLTLVSAVATRWTSTWLSAVSVLQAKDALVGVFTSAEGKERLQAAMSSNAAVHKNLKDVVAIIRRPSFFDGLSEHLHCLLPTIEASLVLQGGTAALADVLYSFARQYQALVEAEETVVRQKLESRFSKLEKPILLLAFWLHPAYIAVSRRIVAAGAPDAMTLATWVDS